VPEARWRIAGVRPWYSSPLGPALPTVAAPPPPPEPVGGAGAAPAEADEAEGPYATKELLPCGCPLSAFINPKNGRTASMTLHGMMDCKRLDWPKKPP
jgi:hypothetical protein